MATPTDLSHPNRRASSVRPFSVVLVLIALICAGLVSAPAHAGDVDLTSGLAAHWPLDLSVRDTSGNEHHGTLHGNPRFVKKTNVRRGVLAVNGRDTFIQLPRTKAINMARFLPRRTVSAWFKLTDVSVQKRMQVIWNEGGIDRGLNIYVYDGSLYVGGWNEPEMNEGVRESGWNGSWISTDRVESGTWHHVVLVLDGQKQIQPNSLKGYLDGTKFGSAKGSGIWKHYGAASIGAVANATTFHQTDDVEGKGVHGAHGLIDDVRVYNRALSSSAINAMYKRKSVSDEKSVPTASRSRPTMIESVIYPTKPSGAPEPSRPDAALQHLGPLRFAHVDEVVSVQFSPDHTRIASGDEDGTIRIWDLQTGSLLNTLSTHDGAVTALAFSPDGSRLASGANGSSIQVHEVPSGKKIAEMTHRGSYVNTLDVSADGTRIVSAGGSSAVQIRNARNGEEVTTLKKGPTNVKCASFSPDGTRVVTGDHSGTVRIWSVSSGTIERSFVCSPEKLIHTVLFTPDGSHVVSGGVDGILRIHDLSGERGNGKPVHRKKVPERILTVALSADGKRIVAGLYNGSVVSWRPDRDNTLRTLGPYVHPVPALDVAPDESHIAFGGSHVIRYASLSDDGGTQPRPGHLSSVRAVAYTPDGRHVVTGGEDASALVWDLQSGKVTERFTGHSGQMTSIDVSPDGKHVISAATDDTLRTWSISSGEQTSALRADNLDFRSVQFSHSGSRIIYRNGNGIIIRNRDTGKRTHDVPVSPGTALSVALSPDRTTLAIGSMYEDVIYLHDLSSGDPPRQLREHNHEVESVAFAPRGGQLLSGSADSTLKLWDVTSGEPLREFSGHTGPITSARFSRDGALIISGSTGGTVRIWERMTGKEIVTLDAEAGTVHDLTVSPNRDRFVAGYRNGTALIWSLNPSSWFSRSDKPEDITLDGANLWKVIHDTSTDPKNVYRRMTRLSRLPSARRESVFQTLKKHVHRFMTWTDADRQRLNELTEQLGADTFKKRQRAQKKLYRFLTRQPRPIKTVSDLQVRNTEARMRIRKTLKKLKKNRIPSKSQTRRKAVIYRLLFVFRQLDSDLIREQLNWLKKTLSGTPQSALGRDLLKHHRNR